MSKQIKIAILADGKQAVHEFTSVAGASKFLGTETTKTTGHLDKMSDGVKSGVTKSLNNLTGQLGPAGAGLQALSSSLSAASTAGLAAGAGVALVQKSVGHYLDLIEQTKTFSALTRASVEDSSRFVLALGDLGIKGEAGAKALGAMSRNLDTKKWQELGIEIKKNADGSTDMVGTFRNVLASLEKIPDAQQRANVLAATFGKSYQEILPLIERGAKGFDALLKGNEGQVIKTDDVKRAEQLRVAMDQLGDLAADFAVQLGRYAVPVITLLAKGASQAAANFAHLFDLAIDGMQKMVDLADVALGPLVNFDDALVRNKMSQVGNALLNVGAAGRESEDSTGLAAVSLDNLGDAAAAAAADLKSLTDAFDKRVSGAFAMSSATDKATKSLADLDVAGKLADENAKASAERAVESGRKREAVEKALAGLAEQRVRNAKDIAAAEKSVADAQDKVTESSRRVDSATADMAVALSAAQDAADAASRADEAYRRVLQGVGVDAESAKNALLGLNEAKDGKSSAEIGVRSADRRLVSARKALDVAQDQNAIDRERESLLLDLADASQIVAKAEKAKAEVMAKGTYFADELADADRNIARARIEQVSRTVELTRRLDDLTDQTDELGKAQDEVLQAELGLSSARRDLDKATAEVAESTRILDGETSGYSATSKEAKEADEKRAKAVGEVTTAHGRVVTAAGAVKKATDDQALAVNGVKEANKALAEKITDAKKAEDDRKKTLEDAKEALGNVATKTKAAKDETVLYRDAVRDAISAQVDFISKSNEASGRVQTDAQVMASAIAKVRGEAERLADPKLAAAIGSVLSGVDGVLKVGAGVVGPITGSSSDAYRTGTGTVSARKAVVDGAIGAFGKGESGPNALNAPGQLLAGRDLAGEVNAWCQAYVNAVLKKADLALPPGISDGTRKSLEAFRRAGAGIGVSQAAAGDLVYKSRGADQSKGHVGIVVSRNGNKITTMEGNSTDDKVARRTRDISEWNLGAVNIAKLTRTDTKSTADIVRRQFAQDYESLSAAQKSAAVLLALQDQGMSAGEAQTRLNDQLRVNGGDIGKAVTALGLTKSEVGEFASDVGGKLSKFAGDVAGSIDKLLAGLAGSGAGSGSFGGSGFIVPPDLTSAGNAADAAVRKLGYKDLTDYWMKTGGAATTNGGTAVTVPPMVLNVYGSVTSERDLVDAIRTGLVRGADQGFATFAPV